MLKTTLNLIALAGMALGGLLVAGCASKDEQPYGLTGQSQSAVTAAEQRERLRYTDQKGRYRPDLRQMGLAQRP